MAKKKRIRIEEVKTFPNVTQTPQMLKGKWKTEIFRNDGGLVLELGCGHGNYTLTLAQRFPNKNFIGIDLKGARLWVGAKQALEKGIANVFFIRGNAAELDKIFEPGEIEEVWIPFPDPYPKKPRKRLTSVLYLALYQRICKPGARLHFKTDDDALYQSTLESLSEFGCTVHRAIVDIHGLNGAADDEALQIRTSYEKRHLAAGRTIKYIEFTLPPATETQGAKSE